MRQSCRCHLFYDIREFIENDFSVMFIPAFKLFGDKDKFKLKYQSDNADEYICINEKYLY